MYAVASYGYIIVIVEQDYRLICGRFDPAGYIFRVPADDPRQQPTALIIKQALPPALLLCLGEKPGFYQDL